MFIVFFLIDKYVVCITYEYNKHTFDYDDDANAAAEDDCLLYRLYHLSLLFAKCNWEGAAMLAMQLLLFYFVQLLPTSS